MGSFERQAGRRLTVDCGSLSLAEAGCERRRPSAFISLSDVCVCELGDLWFLSIIHIGSAILAMGRSFLSFLICRSRIMGSGGGWYIHRERTGWNGIGAGKGGSFFSFHRFYFKEPHLFMRLT